MNHIDLFSGIGGFALAAQWAGFETVAFVEIEPYAQEIIKQNFGAVADAVCDGFKRNAGEVARTPSDDEGKESELGGFAKAIDCSRPRIYSDIRTFDGTRYRGSTLLTGGFSCQPFSQAGKRRGKEDDRYLWPEMLRVIHEARPAWVLGENVAGIVTMELDRVLSDLESEGYAVQALVIPACAVDAKHRRDRVWIVGHAGSWNGRPANGQHEAKLMEKGGRDEHATHAGSAGEAVADASRHEQGRQEQRPGEQVALANNGGDSERWDSRPWWWQREHEEITGDGRRGSRQANGEWLPELDVGRVAHGIPARMDRLKGLGNAIVPQVAFEIVKGIAEIEAKNGKRTNH